MVMLHAAQVLRFDEYHSLANEDTKMINNPQIGQQCAFDVRGPQGATTAIQGTVTAYDRRTGKITIHSRQGHKYQGYQHDAHPLQ